jgi:hypothetical protein
MCCSAPAPAAPEPIAFPDDKPFLRAFHDDFMAPKVGAAGAHIVRVEHHKFMEKYHIALGTRVTVLCVHYKARGTFGAVVRESGDEDLFRQVIEDS